MFFIKFPVNFQLQWGSLILHDFYVLELQNKGPPQYAQRYFYSKHNDYIAFSDLKHFRSKKICQQIKGIKLTNNKKKQA